MGFDTKIGTSLSDAAYWLDLGECVGIPTETVYGLAANALDPAAVVRIFEVKNRPTFDPLIVHVRDRRELHQFVTEIPEMCQQLIAHFWPGPLTTLLPRNSLIPDIVCSGLSHTAFRCPAHPMAADLLDALPFPLAAPSANPFGYISPTQATHVYDQLKGKIPYILDGGPCAVGVESTIVGFDQGEVVVHRLGGVTVEALESVAGKVRLQLQAGSNPDAPGMLASHYAPRTGLVLGLDHPEGQGKRVALLTFRPVSVLPQGLRVVAQQALSVSGNLQEAAQNLFAVLRMLDESGAELILAEPCPEAGLGRAINDRLRRAAFRGQTG